SAPCVQIVTAMPRGSECVEHWRERALSLSKRDRRREPPQVSVLRALIEYRHGAAILRPTGNIIAHRDRPLLAIRDRAHALARNAARHQILADGFGAPRAKRDVVFARATLVGVALDREGVTVVIAQPLRLFVERRAR